MAEVTWNPNTIPDITEPMGKHWKQPDQGHILIDDDYALMVQWAFDMLHTYSTSYPSGVYPGKMWKAHIRGTWYLRWYGEVEGCPNLCSNNQREILIA